MHRVCRARRRKPCVVRWWGRCDEVSRAWIPVRRGVKTSAGRVIGDTQRRVPAARLRVGDRKARRVNRFFPCKVCYFFFTRFLGKKKKRLRDGQHVRCDWSFGETDEGERAGSARSQTSMMGYNFGMLRRGAPLFSVARRPVSAAGASRPRVIVNISFHGKNTPFEIKNRKSFLRFFVSRQKRTMRDDRDGFVRKAQETASESPA